MAAGAARRRIVRGLRVGVSLGLAAVVVGMGAATTRGTGAAPASLDQPGGALRAAADSFSTEIDPGSFRFVLPGGRGPLPTQPPVAAPVAPPAPSPAAMPSPAAPPGTSRAPGPAPAPKPAPAAAPVRLPLGVNPGASTVVITVVAPSSRSTTATLTAWQLGPSGWAAVVGPVTAHIGKDGVGTASEQTSRTPAGTFTLTEAFGRAGNPGTALPYTVINANDYWISDVTSTRYNQFYECSPGTCPFDTAAGEHLWDAGSSYDYAVVINYNRWPAVPGAGSAFFLHVTNGAATAGCVAIDRGSLTAIMRRLTPGARPLIAIGVG